MSSRFLTKVIVRIGGIKNTGSPHDEQFQAGMRQVPSEGSVIKFDDTLLDRARGYLSETQRAVLLSSKLIDAGAQVPPCVDFVSILMLDHGHWYLQTVCPSFDITEIGDLSPPSQWIFACLVRTVSACYESVSRQLQGFPVSALQYHLSAERLTNEINVSQKSLRHRFILSLTVGGSTSMLEALLFHGLSMGDLSTYYLEKATERKRLDMAYLLFNYGASLSLETSTHLLELARADLKKLLLDPRKSEAFCHLLRRTLESCGPLQEISNEHAIFESLIRIFQTALLQSKTQYVCSSKSSFDSSTSNVIIRLLLEAGLFRDSKLPARYWSFNLLLLTNDTIDESPLTLAIYARNAYAIGLLLKFGYDVDESISCVNDANKCDCMEHKGTPLMYAIWLRFTEAVAILLEAGADVTKMGARGQTAPELAKVCLSAPIAQESIVCTKDTCLGDCVDNTGSRHRIFTMICANVKTSRGKTYEEFIDTFKNLSLLRFASKLTAY